VRWDPTQYSRFAAERDRPFFDLTSRIDAVAPRHVVDIGCGQGHLTVTLAQRWPQAVVEGFDSSPEMIADAAGLTGVAFSVADAANWQPPADVDVIVSNAALHWVPHHQQLIAQWSSALPSGGWVAVQVPGNFDSPSHMLMRSLAGEKQWAAKLQGVLGHTDPAGAPESYAKVLLDAGLDADVWETTYVHVLPGDDPVLEWIRGTGLRPVLAALSPSDAEEFATQLAGELRRAYPQGPHGTLFPFRRVFAVGHRP
jgi:trans-aconitate 2-methyltransferase